MSQLQEEKALHVEIVKVHIECAIQQQLQHINVPEEKNDVFCPVALARFLYDESQCL